MLDSVRVNNNRLVILQTIEVITHMYENDSEPVYRSSSDRKIQFELTSVIQSSCTSSHLQNNQRLANSDTVVLVQSLVCTHAGNIIVEWM